MNKKIKSLIKYLQTYSGSIPNLDILIISIIGGGIGFLLGYIILFLRKIFNLI
jgi:hypothetical protein